MKIKYCHQKENFYGNIFWDKNIKLENLINDTNIDFRSQLEKFRALGYYASCYPEGDGIAISDNTGTKTADNVSSEISKIFGWEVEIVFSPF